MEDFLAQINKHLKNSNKYLWAVTMSCDGELSYSESTTGKFNILAALDDVLIH